MRGADTSQRPASRRPYRPALVALLLLTIGSATQAQHPVPEATEFGISLTSVSRGLGDLNGDGRTDQRVGNTVRVRAPSVLLRADAREAVRLGTTTQTIITELAYNDAGQLLRRVDPEGNATTFEYFGENDPHGGGAVNLSPWIHVRTRATGYLRTVTRDADALSPRHSAGAPSPTRLETEFDRDALGRTTSTTNPRGVVTRVEYNALDEPVVITRGADVARAVATGELITGEQAFAYRVRLHYDHNGRVVHHETENRDGNTQGVGAWVDRRQAFDILNNVLQRSLEVDAQKTLTTLLRYDPNENQVLVQRPEQNKVRRVFDERDLLLTRTRGAETPEASTHSFDYDLNGNLVRLTDAQDNDADGQPEATTYRYDGFDRLRVITDALGNQSERVYDPASNVVLRRVFGHPPGRPQDAQVLLVQTAYLHDELNRVYQTDERLLLAFGFTVARPVDLRDQDGDGLVTTRQEYDALSRPTFFVEDDLEVTERRYDGAHRLVEWIDALGNRRLIRHDRNSNPILVTEVELSPEGLVPDETFVTHYVRDQLDRVVRITDNAGQTTRLGYDSRDNLILRSDPEGPSTADPLNLFGGPINGPGNTLHSFFDGADRRIRQVWDLRQGGTGAGALDTQNPTNSDGQVSLSFSFDDNSRLVTLTDDNNNQTRYTWDALDRQTVQTNADGRTWATVYDRDDNAIRVTDPNGTVATRTHDVLNRLVAIDVQRAMGVVGTTRETLEYDGLSRITRRTDDNGSPAATQVCEYVWDSLSRLLEERQNGQPVSNVFTGDGKRLSCTYPGGRQISHTFDAVDRVKTTLDATAAGALIAEHSWIGPGLRELRRVHGNGTQLSYLDATGTQDEGYDLVRRTVRLRHLTPAGVPFVDREYGYNRADQRSFARRHDDLGLSDRYTYDSLYRITDTALDQDGQAGAVPRQQNGFAYLFDGVGNRRSVDVRKLNGTSFNETYQVNEVNEYRAIAGVSRTHSHNGNLQDDGQRTFQYDYRNRLVGVARKQDGAPVGLYHYYPDNRRARKTVYSPTTPGQVTGETVFLYDGWRVCEERSAGGVTEATYVYAPVYLDAVCQVQRTAAHPLGAAELYLHQNVRFDVVAVTDGAGQVVERRVFDDYGRSFDQATKNQVAGSAVGNPYGFQGRRFDPETGLYYFRNRYFDPASGRFLQRDPVWDPGNVGGQYTFVGNGPASRLDPSGRSCIDIPLDEEDEEIDLQQEFLEYQQSELDRVRGIGDEFSYNPILNTSLSQELRERIHGEEGEVQFDEAHTVGELTAIAMSMVGGGGGGGTAGRISTGAPRVAIGPGATKSVGSEAFALQKWKFRGTDAQFDEVFQLARRGYRDAKPRFVYSPNPRMVRGKPVVGVTNTSGQVTFHTPHKPDFATWVREAVRTQQLKKSGYWPGGKKAGQAFSRRFQKKIDREADAFLKRYGFVKEAQ